MSGWVFLFIRILLAVTLYAFLGICLYLIWQSLKKQALLTQDERVPALTLSLPGVKDKIIQQDQTIGILVEPPVLKIVDAIAQANNLAIISYKNTRWWIDPISLAAPIYLNDAKITSPTILTDGDSIQLEGFVITVLATYISNNTKDNHNKGETIGI